MPLFGRLRRAAPRLTPELDDPPLGRLRRQLLFGPALPDLVDTQVEALSRLALESRHDGDRLMHRISVLAEAPGAEALARSWTLRHPGSADARIFSARVAYVRLRGNGPADDSAGAAASAVDDCLRAAALRPEDPTPWVVHLGLCRVLQHPEREFFDVWREVLARDRWNREAHLQTLSYLTACDNTAHWRVDNFLDHCRAHPPDAPTAGLELAASLCLRTLTVQAAGLGDLLADRWWRQPRRAELLDRAVETWTRPGHLRHAAALADLNGLAYALVHAKRLADAALVFRRIGPVVNAWPWAADGDPERQFTSWQRQAERYLPPGSSRT